MTETQGEELLCCGCDDKHLATHRCLECGENYCTMIARIHTRLALSRDHVVLTLSEAKAVLTDHPSPERLFCDTHRRVLEFYCVTCESSLSSIRNNSSDRTESVTCNLLCAHCPLFGPHQGHSLLSLHEAHQRLLQYLQQHQTQLDAEQVELRSLNESIAVKSDELMSANEAICEEINRDFDQMEAELRLARRSLLTRVKDLAANQQNELSQRLQALQERSMSVTSLTQDLLSQYRNKNSSNSTKSEKNSDSTEKSSATNDQSQLTQRRSVHALWQLWQRCEQIAEGRAERRRACVGDARFTAALKPLSFHNNNNENGTNNGDDNITVVMQLAKTVQYLLTHLSVSDHNRYHTNHTLSDTNVCVALCRIVSHSHRCVATHPRGVAEVEGEVVVEVKDRDGHSLSLPIDNYDDIEGNEDDDGARWEVQVWLSETEVEEDEQGTTRHSANNGDNYTNSDTINSGWQRLQSRCECVGDGRHKLFFRAVPVLLFGGNDEKNEQQSSLLTGRRPVRVLLNNEVVSISGKHSVEKDTAEGKELEERQGNRNSPIMSTVTANDSLAAAETILSTVFWVHFERRYVLSGLCQQRRVSVPFSSLPLVIKNTDIDNNSDGVTVSVTVSVKQLIYLPLSHCVAAVLSSTSTANNTTNNCNRNNISNNNVGSSSSSNSTTDSVVIWDAATLCYRLPLQMPATCNYATASSLLFSPSTIAAAEQSSNCSIGTANNDVNTVNTIKKKNNNNHHNINNSNIGKNVVSVTCVAEVCRGLVTLCRSDGRVLLHCVKTGVCLCDLSEVCDGHTPATNNAFLKTLLFIPDNHHDNRSIASNNDYDIDTFTSSNSDHTTTGRRAVGGWLVSRSYRGYLRCWRLFVTPPNDNAGHTESNDAMLWQWQASPSQPLDGHTLSAVTSTNANGNSNSAAGKVSALLRLRPSPTHDFSLATVTVSSAKEQRPACLCLWHFHADNTTTTNNTDNSVVASSLSAAASGPVENYDAYAAAAAAANDVADGYTHNDNSSRDNSHYYDPHNYNNDSVYYSESNNVNVTCIPLCTKDSSTAHHNDYYNNHSGNNAHNNNTHSYSIGNSNSHTNVNSNSMFDHYVPTALTQLTDGRLAIAGVATQQQQQTQVCLVVDVSQPHSAPLRLEKACVGHSHCEIVGVAGVAAATTNNRNHGHVIVDNSTSVDDEYLVTAGVADGLLQLWSLSAQTCVVTQSVGPAFFSDQNTSSNRYHQKSNNINNNVSNHTSGVVISQLQVLADGRIAVACHVDNNNNSNNNNNTVLIYRLVVTDTRQQHPHLDLHLSLSANTSSPVLTNPPPKHSNSSSNSNHYNKHKGHNVNDHSDSTNDSSTNHTNLLMNTSVSVSRPVPCFIELPDGRLIAALDNNEYSQMGRNSSSNSSHYHNTKNNTKNNQNSSIHNVLDEVPLLTLWT